MEDAKWETVYDGTHLWFEGVILVHAEWLEKPGVVPMGEDWFEGESGDRHLITSSEDTRDPHADGPEILHVYVRINDSHVQTLEIVEALGMGTYYVRCEHSLD